MILGGSETVSCGCDEGTDGRLAASAELRELAPFFFFFFFFFFAEDGDGGVDESIGGTLGPRVAVVDCGVVAVATAEANSARSGFWSAIITKSTYIC